MFLEIPYNDILKYDFYLMLKKIHILHFFFLFFFNFKQFLNVLLIKTE